MPQVLGRRSRSLKQTSCPTTTTNEAVCVPKSNATKASSSSIHPLGRRRTHRSTHADCDLRPAARRGAARNLPALPCPPRHMCIPIFR
ncbi:hypothetical protein BU24DRAFT_217804 [Aaosphaeria arxii CBS 175.79]|uniref:Uncharacterized protein n=1 Tax=Aaosphaeria arxii CBS 175.79 TaxID=1450172 RepID=A0A6A5XQQ0_9PLEO|nr:uncharacterized protein BU24DRAFT_217804 [Aaosphaeria arxii CBS 175.79]KAF2014624.1 hypothetical protein BU24DRAFT_217804 [Aaosphaeria arxii CBS 175.79]